MPPFAARVVRWQRRHGRHDLPWQRETDPYRVWLSEVMLQQTRVETVIPYFERFLERFPEVRSLARAPLGEVLRLWSGLGYYARARNLHAAARQIVKAHGGRLPDTLDALEALPGIGRSTAGAIAALAFGRRAPMLDANARRVLERCFRVQGEKALWRLAEELVPARSACTYTQALMDLGAMICTPAAPDCARCPVAANCVSRQNGGVSPQHSPRRPRTPLRKARWLVLVHQSRVLLERRPLNGIWGGLWAFPEAGRGSAKANAGRFGCTIASARKLSSFEHAFTHFRLEVHPVLCEVTSVTNQRRCYRWFERAKAAQAALPSPVRKLLLGRAADPLFP